MAGEQQEMVRSRQVDAEPAAKRAKTSRNASEAVQGNQQSRVETVSKEAESPHKKKLTTHVGRFHKVARNKHVKGYSATDLAAILGANADEQVTRICNKIFVVN